MSNTATWSTCRIICWAVAVVIGLLVMWAIAGGVGFIAALMAAAALAVFIGLTVYAFWRKKHYDASHESNSKAPRSFPSEK